VTTYAAVVTWSLLWGSRVAGQVERIIYHRGHRTPCLVLCAWSLDEPRPTEPNDAENGQIFPTARNPPLEQSPFQWRSQDLVVVRAHGDGAWGGVSPPHEERVWERGCASFTEKVRIFGVKMTCFGALLVTE